MSLEIHPAKLELSNEDVSNRLAMSRTWNAEQAFRFVVGDALPEDEILRIICQRIRTAARLLGLSHDDLSKIFRAYNIFEAELSAPVNGSQTKFLMLEAHHQMQGKVGKGALKVILPRDLIRESSMFVETAPRAAEFLPPAPKRKWDRYEEAWEALKDFLRELITGETLSMTLKSQATGTPFTGSEGVILCAAGNYEAASGRFFLRPVLKGTDAGQTHDKELLDALMNSAAEALTRAGQIAHDRIVHAAETNSTLTSRLRLQLPSNVVEGHLRTLLRDDPHIVIGDEDMTARLRKILARRDYRPTDCPLAKEAARIQSHQAILMLSTREKLRSLLAALPPEGQPKPDQFQEIVGIFFGSGETQQTEDQIFHHREPILKTLSAALSADRLDECEDPQVLIMYLSVLVDGQVKMMKAALRKRMPPQEPLPVDWIEKFPLFTPEQNAELDALLPAPEAGRSEVKRSFAHVLKLLITLKDSIPVSSDDRYAAARMEVIAQAIRAITSGGGIIPSADRIRFFLTPFTYECVTPKLGVVTRKPLDVCGSELRPHAMSAGAVYALEVVLRAKGASKNKPLDGLTVAIQGLGNAGKGVARMMSDRGARIVAVSDSRGALIAPGGLEEAELKALLEHKSAGKRLDTLPLPAMDRTGPGPAGAQLILHKNPEALLTVKADVLVLTAKPASIDGENAGSLPCKVICELTGAAVTEEAKEKLRERSCLVIPDNLGSSGGLLVSLSEMLQNSFGQQWERRLEETTLRQQIEQSHEAMLKLARKFGVDLAVASDLLALKRMHALAVYRVNLETTSQKLREQIQAIADGESVLIVSDDDDDGVAAAAIFHGLIARLNPGKERQILYLNESLRSRAVLDFIEAEEKAGVVVKRVFALDRAFALSATGQQATEEIARRCSLVMINNHDLPEHLLSPEPRGSAKAKPGGVKSPAEMGIVMITPQTLKATLSSRHFTTSLVLREIAHQLLTEPALLSRMDWQAAIGSCLDVPPEASNEWLLFYAQFNPDEMMQAARAIRMVARAHGFMSAIRAVEGVELPDQLETSKPWGEFMSAYELLAERVQLLVEKIVMENIGRPYVSHLFTPAEVTSPVPPVGEPTKCLDLYPWMSEHLTKRADFLEKPIIVGQVVSDRLGRNHLGIRIRSPRGVELMEVGLPDFFRTGGLPNTAVAKIPLDDSRPPEQQFQTLVEDIWWKTVSPTIKLTKRGTEPS